LPPPPEDFPVASPPVETVAPAVVAPTVPAEEPDEADLRAARDRGDPATLGLALLAYADVRQRAGRTVEAASALTEAADIAERTHDDRLGREAAIAAMHVYENAGDDELADAWRQRADAFRQRIEGGLPSVSSRDDAAAPGADASVQGATGLAPAIGDASAQRPAMPAWPWWLAGGSLVLLLAWLRSRRRIASLDEETERLSRHQRHLRSAHAQLQRQAEQLRQTATQDALTGTLTRVAFASALDAQLQHAARFAHPVALFVFDLDHFKQINDSHGHLAGDEALKLVVGLCREKLDSDDLLGRFGGDEFLVACRRDERAEFLPLAESLREAVRMRVAGDPVLGALSLSLGIAIAEPATGYRLDGLFEHADAALYAAKRAGRNRVVLASEQTPAAPDGAPPRSLAG
jgi:diguanylate cyclase (GGDEF)-like protein